MIVIFITEKSKHVLWLVFKYFLTVGLKKQKLFWETNTAVKTMSNYMNVINTEV